MRLQMIGMDHSTAPVHVRERYAFTSTAVRSLMQNMHRGLEKTSGIRGMILLSTCNRMELYVSLAAEAGVDLYQLICDQKGILPGEERALFYEKSDLDVTGHVFELACGLRSQIIGEDQILAQLKDALLLAREENVTDNCIEVLFRRAITLAKELKTEFVFEKGNRSAATAAIEKLQKEGVSFKGKQALVIGNGMMGRLTAQALMDVGAEVTVTVRQYHSGTVDIPKRANRIQYGDRYGNLSEKDFIFSATASPNLTITAERMAGLPLAGKIFVDLAVPRDIDPEVSKLPGVRLLCMDDLSVDQLSEEQKEQVNRARQKIAEALTEYERFFYGRDLIPRITGYASDLSEDQWGRMKNDCKALSEAERQKVEQAVKRSGSKVIAHVLFTLRDGLDADTFARCMDVLEGD